MTHLPPGADCRTVTFLDGIRFHVVFDPSADDPLSRSYAAGEFPHGPFSGLLPHLLRPGAAILDLGGHLGSFALVAAFLGCRVVAVEACPRNAELLRASAERNGFHRLKVVHAAVSDHSGTLEFCAAGPFGVVHVTSVYTPTVTVRALTVDALLGEVGWPRVDLVKMDVEGSEVAAVRGMTRLLSRPDAPPLIYESNGHTLHLFGQTPTVLKAALHEFGYSHYMIEPGRLVPVSADEIQTSVVTDNLAVRGVPNLPTGWRIAPRLEPNDLVTRLFTAAVSSDQYQRLHVARSLHGAPAWLQDHPVIRRALTELCSDLSVEVREAVAWSRELPDRSGWKARLLDWWRRTA
jgi:FkbM family methyltransferase